nr:unnamed protein product [Callosobruchus analis]
MGIRYLKSSGEGKMDRPLTSKDRKRLLHTPKRGSPWYV